MSEMEINFSESAIWKGAKWYDIKPGAYKMVYDNAKERFEDTLSESESITNKAVQMLTAAPLLGGFLLSKAWIGHSPFEIFVLVIVAVLLLLLIGLLYRLIKPKAVYRRGLSATTSVPFDLTNPENEGKQEEMTYYNVITALEQKTIAMKQLNEERIPLYAIAVWIFVVLLVAGGWALISSLSALR